MNISSRSVSRAATRRDRADLGVLNALTQLKWLILDDNSITDISALTSLRYVNLNNNPDFNDLQPLLNNTGLRPGDQVFLMNTNRGCGDVAALQAKGLTVESDCR